MIYVGPMWIATGLQHFMCTFAKQNKLLSTDSHRPKISGIFHSSAQSHSRAQLLRFRAKAASNFSAGYSHLFLNNL